MSSPYISQCLPSSFLQVFNIRNTLSSSHQRSGSNVLLCIYILSISCNMCAAYSFIMNDQHTISTYYAILIDINIYSDSSLKSCIWDVQKIKECLESKLSLVDIQTLMTSSSNISLKHSESWSTSHNMTSALEMITFWAQSEDFIYIHYSDHETRLDSCYDLLSQSIRDLALILLNKNSNQMRLLSELWLTDLLKFMIDKALIITLILDFCFSASIYHNGDLNVWYLSCGCIGTLTYSSILKYDLTDRKTHSMSCNASMHNNWLLNLNQYTILTVCRPHKKAEGGSETSEKREHYRALSYFLFKVLFNHRLER